MISLKNIWKEYKLDHDVIFTALQEINLNIGKGEFTSIIGPSGSGKSTLMHIIGLLDQPSKGSITIEGDEISKLTDNQLSSLRNEFVGFVFQQFNLINKLTIIENILIPAVYTRKKLDYDPKEKAIKLLERFGLADKKNSYPNKISGGQQQRIAIARALIMNPKLILADEPTGNLDTKTGEDILDLLHNLHKKDGITVVIVTHDPRIAKKTERKIEIIDGKISL
jgi:putative ABC transport system ATP-binding protein